jgi:hypothetical protein
VFPFSPGFNDRTSSPISPAANLIPFNRVLKNKHQAVSQGVRHFAKRSLFSDR